jgi:hypothetical protein
MRPIVAMIGFVVLLGGTLTLILLMHSGQWIVALPAAVLFFLWAALVRGKISRPRT